MPSYLSVILFALTNYKTDGIKPPIRSWQTSLHPQKEKDCHGRMSPPSQPLKKPQSSVAICCPHACSHLPASVGCCIYLWPPRHPNTYVSSQLFSPYISCIPPAPHSYFFSGLNSKSCQEAQRPACAWRDRSRTWVFEQCWAMLGNVGQCWVISGNFG